MLDMAFQCQLLIRKLLKNKNFIGKLLLKIKKFTNKKEKPYKKFTKFKSQKSNDQKSNKKKVRCFKCGQKGHIAPNCKNKINVLSDKEE